MAFPPSPPIPSGRCWGKPDRPTRKTELGVRRKPGCENVKKGSWRSPIPIPKRKKTHRNRLHAGRGDGFVCLVPRSGGTISDGSAARRKLAARRQGGVSTARYFRDGTAKLLTLFHPTDGQVRVKGTLSCPNAVLHGWLKQELTAVLATLPVPTTPPKASHLPTQWEAWQADLTEKPTLPPVLPPLRMLLILDNLAGHKTPELVLWFFANGIMPLYTPLGGSWLKMAESIQRIRKRRALNGQHPVQRTRLSPGWKPLPLIGTKNRRPLYGVENGGSVGNGCGNGGIVWAVPEPTPERRFAEVPVSVMAMYNTNDPQVVHLLVSTCVNTPLSGKIAAWNPRFSSVL